MKHISLDPDGHPRASQRWNKGRNQPISADQTETQTRSPVLPSPRQLKSTLYHKGIAVSSCYLGNDTLAIAPFSEKYLYTVRLISKLSETLLL